MNELLDIGLNPAERLGLSKIIVEGPWALPDNYELLDTPGWGHDPVQEKNNATFLSEAHVILCIGSRIAGKSHIYDKC